MRYTANSYKVNKPPKTKNIKKDYTLKTEYQLDDKFRLSAVSNKADSFTESVKYTYYEEGINKGKVKTAEQGERKVFYEYNEKGLLSSILTDPDGKNLLTLYFYDDFNRLNKKILPDGRELIFEYDVMDNITSIRTPENDLKGNLHSFIYDLLGLETEYNPPLEGTDKTYYTYYKDKKIKDITLPDKSLINFKYDEKSRQLKEIVSKDAKINYNYDLDTLISLSRNDTETISVEFTKNSDGFDTTMGEHYHVHTYNFGGFLDDFKISKHFDEATLNFSGFMVNETMSTAYNFDKNSGDIQGVRFLSRDSENIIPNYINFIYDTKNGRISEIKYNQNNFNSESQITTSYEYNKYGEISLNLVLDELNNKAIWESSYKRNNLGQIVQKVENNNVFDYIYTDRGQLEKVFVNDILTEEYSYDANGNRFINGFETKVNAQDQLIEFKENKYTYTKNGYVETCSGSECSFNSLTYDSFGNLVEAEADGRNISYVIDPLNRRIGKKVNGEIEYKLVYKDSLNPTAKIDKNGVVDYYVYISKTNVPDYILREEKVLRVISDHLGSVREVLDITDINNLKTLQKIEYDTFGKVISDTNPSLQPFRFAGGIYDNDTQLLRFGARDYDPYNGRWTAKDPIRFNGGTANLYGYCNNDPVNWVDLEGLIVEDTVMELGGATLGTLITNAVKMTGASAMFWGWALWQGIQGQYYGIKGIVNGKGYIEGVSDSPSYSCKAGSLLGSKLYDLDKAIDDYYVRNAEPLLKSNKKPSVESTRRLLERIYGDNWFEKYAKSQGWTKTRKRF